MAIILSAPKIEKYDQLSLTFDFNKPLKGINHHINQDEIHRYLEFGPDRQLNCFNSKENRKDLYRRNIKYIEDDNIVEIILPQRIKPYHNKLGTREINPIIKDFLVLCPSLPNISTKKASERSIADWLTATFGRFSGIYGYKIRTKHVKSTNRFVCDASFEIKASQDNEATSVCDKTFFRCWVHSELAWNETQKRHVIDLHKSIAYCWLANHPGSGNITWNISALKLWDDYGLTHNLFTHTPIVVGQLCLRSAGGQVKVKDAYHRFLKNVDSIVSIQGSDVVPDIANMPKTTPHAKTAVTFRSSNKDLNPYNISNYSGYSIRWGNRSVLPRTDIIQNGKLIDYFAEVIPYSSSFAIVSRNFLRNHASMSNAEISSGWIKLFSLCVDNFGGVSPGSYVGNSEAAVLSNFLKSIKNFCIYYEDLSFLAYMLSSVMQIKGKIIFHNPNLQHLSTIVNDSLFQSFPRSKQFSLLASCLVADSKEEEKRAAEEGRRQEAERIRNANRGVNNGPAVRYQAAPQHGINNILRDLPGILQQITQRKHKTVDKIRNRDVKSMKDYHDEATKVLNAIKHAPIPIESDSFKFLVDLGLQIPETDYTFVIPETTNDIRSWGQQQAHCIASYAEHAMKKQCLILGVKHIETGEWLGHMQFYAVGLTTNHGSGYSRSNTLANGTVTVSQFYGARNQPIPEPQRSQVLSHLEKAYLEFKAKQEKEEAEKSKQAKANKREKKLVNQ